jgi:hypothetical protein
MKNGFYIICFLGLFPIDLRSQITLQIAAMPQLTPIFDDLYVAGNFNDWNPGDPSYQLTENNGTISIAISAQAGDLLEFKFTRGSWATVEGGATTKVRDLGGSKKSDEEKTGVPPPQP